jgi:undecaprenyl-diphosphatase
VSDLIKVVVLGIIEGVTEFLPISSTGHLIIAAAVIDFTSAGDTFEIFIQIGAVFAVIGFYRADLLSQVQRVRTDRSVQRLWFNILVAFFPMGVVGFFFGNRLQEALSGSNSNGIVAVALILGGIVFLLVERRPVADSESLTDELSKISFKQALGIGFTQLASFIPGVSRSGASIVGGMLSGLSRKTAAEFSFYLAIPTLGTATIYKLITSLDTLSNNDLLYLVVGTVVSAIVAWISIGWLLRYVSKNSFVPFGYYRIIAGLAILILIAAQLI